MSLLLLPDKNRGTKRKTSQKKRTLNPEFNERSVSGRLDVEVENLGWTSGLNTWPLPRFEWELPLDEAVRRKLDISVKSTSSFMSREREPLGKVRGQGRDELETAGIKAFWSWKKHPR